ncbi:MAG: hypothetical protein AB1705_23615 [Verrucomicrobiota bacterium]
MLLEALYLARRNGNYDLVLAVPAGAELTIGGETITSDQILDDLKRHFVQSGDACHVIEVHADKMPSILTDISSAGRYECEPEDERWKHDLAAQMNEVRQLAWWNPSITPHERNQICDLLARIACFEEIPFTEVA